MWRGDDAKWVYDMIGRDDGFVRLVGWERLNLGITPLEWIAEEEQHFCCSEWVCG